MPTGRETARIGRMAAVAAVGCALAAPAGAAAGDVLNDGGPYFVQAEADGAPTGKRPVAIAPADFDGDGRLDVATANSRSGDVTVLLGARRAFERRASVDAGERPAAMAAADLTGDGHADLAVANSRSDDVYVLRGRGNGEFSAERRLPVGDGPADVRAADVDGDGQSDLITANQGSDDVTVLFGDGTGGAETTVTLRAESSACSGDLCEPASVVPAELTGDGSTDLAISTLEFVVVFRNDGARAFSQELHEETGVSFGMGELVTADFDADGVSDLAAAGQFDLGAEVMLDRGATFQSVSTGGTQGLGDPTSIGAGDVDRDGDLDLTLSEERNLLGAYLNQGGATGFESGHESPIGENSAATLADFTRDERPDLAVARPGGEVVLFANRARLPRPSGVKVVLREFDGNAFRGRVRSGNAECLATRVLIFSKQPGRDEFIGDHRSNRVGEFKVRFGGNPEGKYYAAVGNHRVPTGVCDAARSNRLRF